MPCKADAASVEWVDSDAGLASAVAAWGNRLGLDTEFQRTDTFFPRPGLYQVCCGEDVWLLDPLTITDFSPLLEALEDRRVTTIMHACSEDLELLRHHFGAVPVGLFDTQLANAFVSPHYSVSFTRLVAERLGVELVQHETRSDWLARPLTPEQIRYAREDVYFLPPLHDALSEALDRAGRQSWFREEMDLRGRFQPADPDEYYLGIARAWKLSGPVRARLQALAAWRERQAMAEDRPRNRIVRDEHLLHLAQQDDVDADAVREALPRGVARRYEADLVAAWSEGEDAAAHPPAAQAPLGGAANAVVRRLRDIARGRAEDLGMAPELLARKREVEACVRHYLATRELSEAYLGWRAPLVGEAFLAELATL
ncbi:MAG: ribonuclease D [Gammaproteobacteria bacterium]|nr:ribonuclease D [Gammaproteobacteria bacterium]|tara:strand:+ start:1362 stop:2471 length:1110 start_codon:yes stop_codon:yes gene_type:complete